MTAGNVSAIIAGGIPARVSPAALKWAKEARGLSPATLGLLPVADGSVFFPDAGKRLPAIFFQYADGWKARSFPDKNFVSSKGFKRSFWNLERVLQAKSETVYIAEGECFPPSAEILTSTGWQAFRDYDGSAVAQVFSDSRATMVDPVAVIKKPYVGKLVAHSCKGYFSETTPDHQLVSIDYRKRWRKHRAADGANWTGDLIPRACFLDGPGVGLSEDQLALALAVSADAAIDIRKVAIGHNGYLPRYARMGLKKPRKIMRLRGILERLGIEFANSIQPSSFDQEYFGFTIPEWCPGRFLPHAWIAMASHAEREFILAEMVNWDGNFVKARNQTEYSSKYSENAIFMQSIAHTSGRCSSIIERKTDLGEWNKVSILHGKRHSTWQSMSSAERAYGGDVYCVTVPSGMILVRQNGKISVTGNCDVLAMVEAGISIDEILGAQGAKEKRGENDANVKDMAGYAYVEEALAAGLSRVKKFVWCGDGDGAGHILREDMVKLLGAARFWFIEWPEGIKDANDMLLKDGPEALRELVRDGSLPWPVNGIYRLSELPEPAPMVLWEPGFPQWERKVMLAPRTLSVVTGHPGHGKTFLWNQVWFNVVQKYGIPFCGASFETRPKPHVRRQLRTLLTGKREWEMDQPETVAADRWINDRYLFLVHPDQRPNLEWFLDMAEVAVVRHGARIIQCDPWNRLEGARAQGENETDYILRCLRTLYSFAIDMNCHIQIVAHPSKMEGTRRGQPPMLEDLAGSKHWDNVVDQGFTVHRPKMFEKGERKTEASFYHRKARFEELGYPCKLDLDFKVSLGKYVSVDYEMGP